MDSHNQADPLRSTSQKSGNAMKWAAVGVATLMLGAAFISTGFIRKAEETQKLEEVQTAQIELKIGPDAKPSLTIGGNNNRPVATPTQPRGPFSFADLVEDVRPSVVSIQIRSQDDSNPLQERLPGSPFDRFFRRDGEENLPRSRPQFGQGSGFIISEDGFVVTNNHVVENATEVRVINFNGETINAEIIGTDTRTDLALLKLEDQSGLPFVQLAEDQIRVGDWVVAVGNPFGLGGSVTAGIISALGREINAGPYDDFIQIDAAINRGNSGGPAFDLNGKVVGVNTAIFTPSGGNVGIAFAIPASTVRTVVDALKKDGVVTRGWLGVSLRGLNQDIADGLGLPDDKGALIAQLQPDGPAEKSGLKSEDVIVGVNGVPIEDPRDLSRMIAAFPPESEIDVELYRDGEKINVKVTLGMLDEDNLDFDRPQFGRSKAEIELGLRVRPDEDGAGLRIIQVVPDSEAERKGLQPGDVITRAGGRRVETNEDLDNAIDRTRERGRRALLLRLDRNGQTLLEALRLPRD